MKTSCSASAIFAALLFVDSRIARHGTPEGQRERNGHGCGRGRKHRRGRRDQSRQTTGESDFVAHQRPVSANEDFGYGPSHNGYKFTLNIQPVIPISLNKDWNLILRTIFPIVSQHDLFYVENVPKSLHIIQNRSQDGLSDTTQSFFLSPKVPGPFGLIWGIGPVFLYPTGTHPFLGTGTFSIGPTVVVLKQMGGLTAGALMNQLWSVAIEEDRKSVSQMFLQPFLAYTTNTHTTFTLSTEATANWNNTPGDAKWTIPLIFQVSQILKLGKQPISIQIGGKYYADTRATGPIGVCA